MLARSILVLSLADVFFLGEELAHGAAAKAVLDGLPVALPRLSYQYYEGGGLIASLLTAPVFAALGPSHLANKLVALGFDVANLIAGLLLVRRAFGERAAWPFTLLYAFGPAACQQIALLNVGNHHAAIGFFFAVAWLALPILRRPRGSEPSALRCLCLGMAAGFGTAFNFLLVPFVGYVAAALLASPPRPRARSWGWLAAGFAIGALPLIWTVLLVGSQVLDVHGIDLRRAFGAPPTSGGRRIGAILEGIGPRAEVQLLALALLPLWGVFADWRSRAGQGPSASRFTRSFLLVFLWIFTAASVLSRFHPTSFDHWTQAFRYLPHWGLAVLLSASVLGELRSHPARLARWSGNGLLAAIALLGVSATLSLAREGKARGTAHVLDVLTRGEGFDYNEYLPKLVAHLKGDRATQLGILLHFDDDPRALYPEIAWALYPAFDGPPSDTFRELLEAGGEHGHLFLLGLGRALLADSGWDAARAVRATAHRQEDLRPTLFEALGRHGGGGHPVPAMVQHEIELFFQVGAPPSVFVGVGQRLHVAFRLDPEGAREFVAAQRPEIHHALGQGLETAMALGRIGGVANVSSRATARQ